VAAFERSELNALFLRIADVLEQSADLAEQHAERYRCSGGPSEIELEAAARAHQAAARARTFASLFE
jgi:hypothetical protein